MALPGELSSFAVTAPSGRKLPKHLSLKGAIHTCDCTLSRPTRVDRVELLPFEFITWLPQWQTLQWGSQRIWTRSRNMTCLAHSTREDAGAFSVLAWCLTMRRKLPVFTDLHSQSQAPKQGLIGPGVFFYLMFLVTLVILKSSLNIFWCTVCYIEMHFASPCYVIYNCAVLSDEQMSKKKLGLIWRVLWSYAVSLSLTSCRWKSQLGYRLVTGNTVW